MAAGAATALMGLVAVDADAASQQSYGDPLTDAANATFGCEVAPGIGDTSGNHSAFTSTSPTARGSTPRVARSPATE
jgi:hypothetical protein